MQKVVQGCEFKAGLCHLTIGNLSSLFLIKDKALKGEGWASPFTCFAQDKMGL